MHVNKYKCDTLDTTLQLSDYQPGAILEWLTVTAEHEDIGEVLVHRRKQ